MAEGRLELITQQVPETSRVEAAARKAEADGWDGISFTDSQNLVGDPFIAMALAAKATDRLLLATGVSNVVTRHPAALATAVATVQEVSGGRAVLGVGRGDTSLYYLGQKPLALTPFCDRVTQLHTYLQGGTVDLDGFPSRLRWLRRATQPPVPLDLVASGPKVIAFAAGVAERLTLAVGADPDRVSWALDLARNAMKLAGRSQDEVSFGAYVNVGCHPDMAVARDLIRGGIAAFAHFSAMPGSTGAGLRAEDRAVVAEVGRRYDSTHHLENRAEHSQVLTDDFVDRFAVVGPPDRCIARLRALADLGVERFVITGPTFDAERDQARVANRLVRDEVLPGLRPG